MNREQVLVVVKQHLANVVEDLDVAELDTSLSMKDLGVNSLDMVDIVSRSLRELRIKVPRSELAKLTNIDGLVDLLFEALSVKVQ